MKNIVVLEKKELEILKGGETIRLMLPNGESIELGLDGAKRRKYDPSVHSESAWNGNGSGLSERIMDAFRNKLDAGWHKSGELAKLLGEPAVYSSINGLAKAGKLMAKENGKNTNGTPAYLYKLSKKGAQV